MNRPRRAALLLLLFPLTLGVLFAARGQTPGDDTLPPFRAMHPLDPLPPPFRHRPPFGTLPFWPTPFQQRLRVDSVKVETAITGGVAQTSVSQVWRNDSDVAQEGSYIFPLPDGAAVSDFALYDGDTKMTARLLDKDQASDTYEGIVRRERDPALLRYVGRGAYEVKLYPVPAHGTRRVTLRYTEALAPASGGAQKYVYSFQAGTLGGGPSGPPPRKTTVQVTLASDAPLANIYSPSQDISVRHTGDNTATVSWEGGGQTPSDFVLYYGTTRRDPVGLSLLAYNVSLPGARTAAFDPGAPVREGKRDSGYFLLLASPKMTQADTVAPPKRVVLVLDRSGSMTGPKIEQARGALAFVLRALRPQDRFNVMTFNEDNDVFSAEGLLPATPDNVRRGLAFVKDIEAEGGTNIHGALDTALKMFPAETGMSQNMVVFLTDGLPTVGETDDAKITAQARTLSRARHVRLFDFGVGYDVDVHFLDRLALANRGDSAFVRPEEDIEATVSRFYNKVASPVLTDVALEINGVRTADVFPRPDELPDLFAGSQLLLAGRYTGSGPVTARLTGMLAGKPVSYALATALPAVADANDFLPRLWATRKIGYLLDAIRLKQTESGSGGEGNGGDPELVAEIVRLSKDYGVVTPYTSFLATDGSDSVDRPGPIAFHGGGFGGGGFATRHGLRVAPGVSRVYALPSAAASPMIIGQAYAAVSGAAATTQSRALHAAKQASVADGLAGYDRDQADALRGRVRVVGPRTFTLVGGTWTDSAFDPAHPQAVTVVRAYSDAYFALLRAVPSLAAPAALGDSVLLVLDNGLAVRFSAGEGKTALDAGEIKRLTR